jgi:hypothetical protein
MMLIHLKRYKIIYIVGFFIFSVFFLQIALTVSPNIKATKAEIIIMPSGLTGHELNSINPTFQAPIEPTWYPTYEGDGSDVVATTGANQVNSKIIGDSREQQVLLNSENYLNWEAFNKSDLVIVPQRNSVPYYGVTADGAWCSHWWNENEAGGQPKNTPRMNWKTLVSMPVDMSDYIITSANFTAIINGSVDANIDTPGDTIARTGFAINQHQIYDYAQFYVEISTIDVNELNTYRIAFNQTRLLGNEALSLYNIEGYIGTFGEQAIIAALNNVLAVDPGHNNFTIVLGIYIYCEDNQSGTDWDYWNDLRFKTLNMTFSYVKKINQFTAVSWNQNIGVINGTNVQVTSANLKFKFKIDKDWTNASQNSQIRIYINDRRYYQTIPLIDYVYSPSFQEARPDGYDLVSEVLPYENFTFSLQVFLAEDFGLSENITISFTDVYLHITYTTYTPDIIPQSWLFLGLFIIAVAALTVTGGYLIAYYYYLRYPIPVRKVRKYRKTLPDSKNPTVPIASRERSFERKYKKQTSNADKFLGSSMGKAEATVEKGAVKPERGLK